MSSRGAFASLFPGQGSQHPGMGRFLYDEFKIARETFEEASDALAIDFKKLCFDGSEAELALTENTQPCLLLVSTATFRVVRQTTGIEPVIGAGHSVGEYSALVAADAITFNDAIKATRLRGQSMQSAVPVGHGGMVAAIGLSPEQTERLCQWVQSETADSPLEPANFNAPGQIVLSGKTKLIDWLIKNYKPEVLPEAPKAKFIPLKVSAPFHCSMMKPAEDKMRSFLEAMTYRDSTFPVVVNVTGVATTSGKLFCQLLLNQITAPVRWIDCISTVKTVGTKKMIEFGSGRVLAGLNKKIDPEIQTFNINSIDDIKNLETHVQP